MSYRTDTRALVLATLADGPRHGYGIARAIRDLSEEVLKLGEGQLYPVLHDLEEQGLVTAEWEMQDGDPPRRVYALTAKGRADLVTRAKKWHDYAAAVANVLPKPMEPAHE
jgi:PadR family transcriptional regulator, regulatory protein PadR